MDKIQSLSIDSAFRDAVIRIVRHKTKEDMRKEIMAQYLDSCNADQEIRNVCIEKSKSTMEKSDAITTSEYKDGIPLITVYIPLCVTAEQMSEIVSHESLHVAMCICRHELVGEMYSHHPVHVSTDDQDLYAVYEESVATIVGQVAQAIGIMLQSVSAHADKIIW